MPMLRKVKDIAERAGIKCQVSLEQRMGCGIGACLCARAKPESRIIGNTAMFVKTGLFLE